MTLSITLCRFPDDSRGPEIWPLWFPASAGKTVCLYQPRMTPPGTAVSRYPGYSISDLGPGLGFAKPGSVRNNSRYQPVCPGYLYSASRYPGPRRAVAPALQDRVLNATPVERVENIAASHSAYFSKPEALTRTILKLAGS